MRTRVNDHTRPSARPIVPVDPALWNKDAIEFLKALQGLLPPGWFSLCRRDPTTGAWKEAFFHNRRDWAKAMAFLGDHPRERYDLYFSVNAFFRPERKAAFCLETCFVHADLDETPPQMHEPIPGVSWESSPGRYQSITVFAERRPAHVAERTSEFMVKHYGGDRGGWSCAKVLRLPGTINHKPHYRRPLVRLLSFDLTPQADWPRTNRRELVVAPKICVDPHRHDWQAVVKKYRSRIRNNWDVRLLQHTIAMPSDRSRLIYKIVHILNDAGASPEEIGAVLWRSPYFVSKYADVRDRHDILDKELSRILGKAGGGR